MLESSKFRSFFLKTTSINIGKSRRYSILNRDCEIDGYSAVCLFLNDRTSYNEFSHEKKNTFRIKEPMLFLGMEVSPRYFVNNINRFVEKVGFSLDDLCSLFRLNIYKARLLLGRGESLPISACLYLEALTQTCLPLWFSKELDTDSLAKNWISGVGKKMHLPSRYIVEVGSKVRLFETAVLYVDQKIGAEYSDYILSYLQITRDLFSFPDRNISLSLFRDFHKCLRCFDVNDEFFIEMGAYNINYNKLARIDFNQRVTNPTVQKVFKEFSKYISPRVDKNYVYETVVISSEKIIIHSKPKNKALGSLDVALYRLGHICCLPSYFDLKSMNIEKSYIKYNFETDECVFILFS